MRLISVLVPLALLVSACSGTAGDSSAVGESPGGESSQPTAVPSVAPTSVPTVGTTRTDATGVDQVWVPAGTFQMGTDAATLEALAAGGAPPWVVAEFPSEQPAHTVTLTQGYWIDRTEVTNAAFAAFVEAGGYTDEALWSAEGWKWLGRRDAAMLPASCPGDEPDLPRRCITWWEAEAYATWRGGTLPTEAQWEFAARGPDSTIYPWGEDWDPALANVVDSAGAVAVGSYPEGASWVGALDMAGNAMEWVADWLGEDYYASSPTEDPTGPAGGRNKVEKGGWWGSNEFVARSAYRHYEDPPTYQDHHIGFRVVSR